ncbi:MAG TPA: DHH family phosphoesterase [bacterium]|nr:DHH family phosphoesterase [bacterium]
MARTNWKLTSIDNSDVKRLEYGLGISELAATVLVARGLGNETAARGFLESSLDALGDPFLLPDMEIAVERLMQAVANDDHIVVLGHDDVDGITATTIVFGALKEIGADVAYYIPDSPTEGLGFSRALAERFKKAGGRLVVTVDCGISCKDEITFAKSLGIDTIVTDHHEPPDELPPAVAVVDAKRRDSKYGFRDLAGCGVAYRFVEAFAARYRQVAGPPSLDGTLGMAALGSYADRVPLVGENRILVRNGMRQVLQKRVVPFAVLKSHVWVDDESTMSEVFSKIIPILGAARSDGGGNLGCELLLSTEEDDAEEILTTLVMECERKKEKGRKALERVEDHLAETGAGSGKSLVMVEEHLPNKTVGFCTAKVAESIYKPVVIISMRGDTGVGEARGPKGVNLVDALAANKQFLLGYGGHKQAAGFSIERSKIEDFKAGFTEYMESALDPSVIRREIRIDGKLALDDLKVGSFKTLLCLEPFGEENRKPVFLLENLDVGVLKEIDGTTRLGEVGLSGGAIPADRISDPGGKLNLVVSPFADGSVRSVEIVDWNQAK